MRKISVGEMYMYRGYMLNIDTNEVDLERDTVRYGKNCGKIPYKSKLAN